MKPIELNDQGIYYAVNRKTGGINNVFQLIYEDAEWYLYQLKNTDKEGGMGWVILADQGDYVLENVDVETVECYFAKPEYLEPKGVWQIMRNARYGFGKFTPESLEMNIHYGMILFSGDEMLVPILLEKAEDALLQSLAEIPK
ncbi:MAG: hypothetical protein ACKE5M_05940 [Methylophilaceae bacterium]